MKDSLDKTSMPEKVAVALRESLEDGELAHEMYLPSSRELASKYGTSLLTVQKALRQLKDEKVIRLHSKRRGFIRVRDIGRNGHTAVKRIAVIQWVKDSDEEGTIPGLVDFKRDDWSGHIIDRFMQSLSGNGYNCMPVYYDLHKSDNVVEDLISQIDSSDEFDGAVFAAVPSLGGLVDELDRRGIRWVSLNPMPGFVDNFVTADNTDGGRIIGKYFMRMGLKRIAYVCAGLGNAYDSMMIRLMGLVQVLMQEGFPLGGLSNIIARDNGEAEGRLAVAKYLEAEGTPDLIFCSGDHLALGATNACLDKGYSVGGDVGVIGATGLPYAAHYTPRMSVLAQPMMGMGDAAADMLRTMLKDDVSRIRGEYVPSKFIIRQSMKIDNAVIRSLQEELGDQIVVDV